MAIQTPSKPCLPIDLHIQAVSWRISSPVYVSLMGIRRSQNFITFATFRRHHEALAKSTLRALEVGRNNFTLHFDPRRGSISMRPISLAFCLPNPFRPPRNFPHNALLRSIIQPRRFSQAACRTQTLRLSLQQFPARQPCCLRQVFPRLQVRFYSSRRPSRPIITSFPQYNPRPITQSPVFWGGLGFVGLLIWSPIPGWVLLGGICYGFYRLFRSLKRAQNAIFGPRNGLLSTEGDGLSFIDSLFARDPRTREVAAKIQEMAMERVEQAIETNEESIRRVFPVGSGETSGEFHFTFPTEVNMVNAAT